MVSEEERGRRERRRAEREARILAAAVELAERDGWEAVTTRALAAAIGHSQPVLYDHFPQGRSQIVTRVALDAFGDLARDLEAAAVGSAPQVRARRVAEAYLAYAAGHPATYDAMFRHGLDVPFAATDTPPALQAAFGAVAAAVGTRSPSRGAAAEVLWSTLHGMATLERDGRLPEAGRAARLEMLVRMVSVDGVPA